MNSQAQPPPKKPGAKGWWLRITLGVVMLGLVVFIAWNGIQLARVFGDMGAIGDFVLPVDEGQVVAASITTTTQPSPTTEPEPTTTVPETTTTTSLPSVDRDELGLLGEGKNMFMQDAYSARLSGVVLSVEVEEVVHPEKGTPTDTYVLYVDLGDHPESGEPVVGRLYLAASEIPARYDMFSNMGFCRLSAYSMSCRSAMGKYVSTLLEPGVQYDFYVVMEFYNLPLQRGHDSLLSGNRALVSALKGGDLPDPDEMGYMGRVDIPPGVGVWP